MDSLSISKESMIGFLFGSEAVQQMCIRADTKGFFVINDELSETDDIDHLIALLDVLDISTMEELQAQLRPKTSDPYAFLFDVFNACQHPRWQVSTAEVCQLFLIGQNRQRIRKEDLTKVGWTEYFATIIMSALRSHV